MRDLRKLQNLTDRELLELALAGFDEPEGLLGILDLVLDDLEDVFFSGGRNANMLDHAFVRLRIVAELLRRQEAEPIPFTAAEVPDGSA